VFVWFFAGGLGHFLLTDFFLRIVPPYIPWPQLAVYVSGALELLGAAGVLVKRTRALAGAGLILLTLCVTPANVYMWMHAELFPAFSPSLLAGRLVLQLLLIGCIWWSTRPEPQYSLRLRAGL
jgi:uncharacterized membrane protein